VNLGRAAGAQTCSRLESFYCLRDGCRGRRHSLCGVLPIGSLVRLRLAVDESRPLTPGQKREKRMYEDGDLSRADRLVATAHDGVWRERRRELHATNH
jgi:hypothetical protein